MSKQQTKLTRLASVAMLAAIVSGCAGGLALHHDFNDYGTVYADLILHQLLLNLARTSRAEPPSFIQLNNISAGHTFTGQLQYQPSYAYTSPHFQGNKTLGIQKVFTNGGGATATDTENPVFSIVPLSGDTFAKAIFSPLDKKIFFILYDQNLPADEVARVLFESIQIGDNIYVNDPTGDPVSYKDFLKWCIYLRYAQLMHIAVVKTKTVNPKTVLYFKKSETKLGDVASAKFSGLEVENGDDGELIKVKSPSTDYVLERLEGSNDLVNQAIEIDEKPLQSFHTFLNSLVVANGEQNGSGDGNNKNAIVFKMRTFARVLLDVSTEADWYNAHTPIDIDGNKVHALPINIDDNTVYALPILNINKSKEDLPLKTLVALSYKGREYAIADPLQGADYSSGGFKYTPAGFTVRVKGKRETLSRSRLVLDGTYPNHSVFALLSILFTQVSVDPKLLPVQQTVRVQ